MLFVQKPCSGPACADGSLLRHEQVFRGPVTVRETKNPPRRRTGRIPFLSSLQCFNRESLPLSTVIFVKMHQRNIFCLKTCFGNMFLIEISMNVGTKTFSVKLGGDLLACKFTFSAHEKPPPASVGCSRSHFSSQLAICIFLHTYVGDVPSWGHPAQSF